MLGVPLNRCTLPLRPSNATPSQAVGLVWDVRLPTEAQKQLKLKTGGGKAQPAAPIKAAMVEARPAVSDAAMAN